MKKFIALLMILGLLAGCTAPGSPEPTEDRQRSPGRP